MDNKKVRVHGLHFFLMSPQLPGLIFDSHLLFDQATELDWAEVDVPYPVVNLFESDPLTGTHLTDIYPVAVPADLIGSDYNRRKFARVR